MSDPEFLNGKNLTDRQLSEVARLLCTTGYYEQVSLDNKLHLPTAAFQKQQTVMPYLAYTQALLLNETVIGFYIVTTRLQMLEIEQQAPNFYRDDPPSYLQALKNWKIIILERYRIQTLFYMALL